MYDLSRQPEVTSFPGPDDIIRHRMSNNIVVLVRENPTTPTVVLEGLLRAGAVHTPTDKAGLASFAAEALLRGAGKRSFIEIFEAIESVGASLGFAASQNLTEFGCQCLAEDLDQMLDLIRDALFAPAFAIDQLERLRGQIITGLNTRAHNTRHVANRAFLELAYPADHPYSRGPEGTVETVAAITRRDMVNFHQNTYVPQGMIIAVVGDVKADDVIRRLESRLVNWSAAPGGPDESSFPNLDVDRMTTKRERSMHVAGKTQSDIVIGWPGPRRSEPDYMHARLANSILGVFGLMGRLGKSVREQQGLAYYAYSGLQGGLGPGPWQMSAGVNPVNVRQAIDSMLDQVRQLQDQMVPADEMADNKTFAVGSLPIYLETNQGVASTILNMELHGLGLDYVRQYPEMIMSISAEQVQIAAQKYLDPDRYALAVAGPDWEPEGK